MRNPPLLDIVRELCAFRHRGAATDAEAAVLDRLEARLENAGAEVARQAFKTPKTSFVMLWWAAGLMAIALLAAPYFPIASTLGAVTVAISLTFYLDARRGPLSRFGGTATSHNLVARRAGGGGPEKLILMAHWDSAPVSGAHHEERLKRFREQRLLFLAMFWLGAVAAGIAEFGIPLWLRAGWAVILFGLVWEAARHFHSHGYSPGANDNASGVAAATVLAERLWADPTPGWQVELVLTGANAQGLLGAEAFYEREKDRLSAENTVVLNFDSVGRGALRFVRRTRALTTLAYDDALLDAAARIAAGSLRFQEVKAADDQLADLDGIALARADLPVLNIVGQSEDGFPQGSRRTDDRADRLEPALIERAVDFGEAVAREVASLRAR